MTTVAGSGGRGAAGAPRAFGRYVVLETLGEGGMGVVLAAYDPELDRRVAIKVLRPEAIAGGSSKAIEHTVRLDGEGNPRDLVRERILAEGRAMARLSHPNLVAVYEVGATADGVFLVMEHVAGETLAAWCEREERSWQAVVAAFVQVGRALAAAHQASIVHGDVKPDNALVDPSGRVRVIDFGLARAAGSRGGDRLAGTPRFMAPELLRGQPADPRSDQYAFATALYHALYGEWPVPEPPALAVERAGGVPVAALAAVERAGGVPRAPSARRGPRSIERALLRALAPAPTDRFGTMEELLAALERRRGARWRAGLAAGLGAAVTAAVLLAAGAGRDEAAAPCGAGQNRLAGAWDAAVRARVQRALAGADRPHAPATADLVARRLDAYAAAWAAERQDACEATEVRREQSAELMDRRMACLEDRRRELAATSEVLSGAADGALVDRAVEIASALEPPAACGDAERLWARPAPPADPAVRALLAALGEELARARAERRAGRLDRAAGRADQVLAEARRLGHPPLLAEASADAARGRELAGDAAGAEQALLEALRHASRAGDDALSAAALIDLVRVIGYRQRRAGEGELLRRLTEAQLERVSPRQRAGLEARLLLAAGDVFYGAGRAHDAEPLYRDALERRRASLEPDHPDLASAEMRVAVALDDLGRRGEAREHHRRALAIREAAFGPAHPLVADVLANLGRSHDADGDIDQARALLERSLAILADVPAYNATAGVLAALAEVETAAGRFERAHELFARALERQRDLGEHPAVASTLYNLGYLHAATGELDAALAVQERALAIRRARLGDASPLVALSRSALAELLAEVGRHREALVHADAAAEILRAELGPDHELVAEPLTHRGAALIGLGRAGEAVTDLERAAAQRAGGAGARAQARLALARALWDSGRDRPRALELARQARAELAAAGPRWSLLHAAAGRWLARRAVPAGSR